MQIGEWDLRGDFDSVVVDEISYLPVIPGQQSVLPARQRPLRKRCDDPHAALQNGAKSSAIPSSPQLLLDRLLHHAVVFQIEGQAIGYPSTPTSCPNTSDQSPTSNPRLYRRPCAGVVGRQKMEAPISRTADHHARHPHWGILLRHFELRRSLGDDD